MSFSKSYKVLIFLNKPHNLFLRLTIATTGWLGTLIATHSAILAKRAFTDFMTDHFKTAFRRSGWYLRNSWINLEIIKDNYFDFTEGLTSKETKEIELFLNKNKQKHHIYQTNKLYIIAYKIHQTLQNNQDASELINNFYETCAKLFSYPIIQKSFKQTQNIRSGDFSVADAHHALSDLATVAPSHEWGWYLISGTLLGFIREKSFLAHDYDIDLGVHAESFNLDYFIDTIESSDNFVIKKIDNHCHIKKEENILTIHHTPALIKIIHKSGINIDIFLHHKEGKQRWHGSTIHKWVNTDFEISNAVFLGIDVLIPDKSELYLEENYGDWRTPVHEFECTTGTPNLVISRNFLSIALFIKKLTISEYFGDTKSVKIRQVLINNNIIELNNNSYTIKKPI